MGTQQLLLIVLGVVIVGIAIAIGVTLFKSNAQSSNRDQLINDLENLAWRAQAYYRRPTTMAGGGNDFGGYYLMSIDTGNDNGSYSVSATEPTSPTYVPGDTTMISGSAQTIYIIGCGKAVGNDGTDAVKAYITVNHNTQDITILN